MASTYRDRTSEFRSLTETLKMIEGVSVANSAENAPATTSKPAPSAGSFRYDFNKKASRIGQGIYMKPLKRSRGSPNIRLIPLAKRSSMFDDPPFEIQELTALIKDDITALNMSIQDLQIIQNVEMDEGKYSEDKSIHSKTVCDDLKNKLMGTTKQLQDVLKTRTQNMKAHESRKQFFSIKGKPLGKQANYVLEPVSKRGGLSYI